MSLRTEIIRIMNELVVIGKKITSLPSGGTLDGTELFESVQSGVSVKVTAQQIADLAASGGTLPTGINVYIGTYDASSNHLPSTGGTGPAGVVLKGNYWIVSVASTTLTMADGSLIPVGQVILAKKDFPSTTNVADWAFWASI